MVDRIQALLRAVILKGPCDHTSMEAVRINTKGMPSGILGRCTIKYKNVLTKECGQCAGFGNERSVHFIQPYIDRGEKSFARHDLCFTELAGAPTGLMDAMILSIYRLIY